METESRAVRVDDVESSPNCQHCGATPYETLNSNYRGCRYCRQMHPAHAEMNAMGMAKLSAKSKATCRPMTEDDYK